MFFMLCRMESCRDRSLLPYLAHLCTWHNLFLWDFVQNLYSKFLRWEYIADNYFFIISIIYFTFLFSEQAHTWTWYKQISFNNKLKLMLKYNHFIFKCWKLMWIYKFQWSWGWRNVGGKNLSRHEVCRYQHVGCYSGIHWTSKSKNIAWTIISYTSYSVFYWNFKWNSNIFCRSIFHLFYVACLNSPFITIYLIVNIWCWIVTNSKILKEKEQDLQFIGNTIVLMNYSIGWNPKWR